jgi:hypothetical protein
MATRLEKTSKFRTYEVVKLATDGILAVGSSNPAGAGAAFVLQATGWKEEAVRQVTFQIEKARAETVIGSSSYSR